MLRKPYYARLEVIDMKVKIVVPVWGADYIDTFLNLSLPAQMCPDGIPEIAKRYEVTYVIYSTSQGIISISKSGIFEILNSIVAVKFVEIPSKNSESSYTTFSKAYVKELNDSSGREECVYLLNADIIVSSEFYQSTLQKIELGFKAINVYCPRALLNSVASVMQSRSVVSDHISYNFAAEELKRIWINNIHPLMMLHRMPKLPSEDVHPSSFFWNAASGGVYIRSFHLYPIVLVPRGNRIRTNKTIDSSAISKLKLKPKEIYTEVLNSDFFCFEVTKDERRFAGAGSAGESSTYTRYFRSCEKENYTNLYHEILIGEISDPELEMFRSESNDFLLRIMLENLAAKKPFFCYSLYVKFSIIMSRLLRYAPKSVYSAAKLTHAEIIHRLM